MKAENIFAYHLKCDNEIISGTVITVIAEDESDANEKVASSMEGMNIGEWAEISPPKAVLNDSFPALAAAFPGAFGLDEGAA